MTEVLLLHHALGLTPGVLAFADEIRAAGHVVHTPDLYDGKTFTAIDDGVGYAREVGFGTIGERGRREGSLTVLLVLCAVRSRRPVAAWPPGPDPHDGGR